MSEVVFWKLSVIRYLFSIFEAFGVLVVVGCQFNWAILLSVQNISYKCESQASWPGFSVEWQEAKASVIILSCRSSSL